MGAHQRQVGVVRRIADGAGVPNEVQRRQIFCLQPVAKPVGNVGPVEVGLRVFFPEFSDADNDLLRQEVAPAKPERSEGKLSKFVLTLTVTFLILNAIVFSRN